MGTLKDVAMQLKSITNIQKITASMKMVASAKYARAERELRLAKPYGAATSTFYEKAGLVEEQKSNGDDAKSHLVIAVTSDRGLCGAANSSISKVTPFFTPCLILPFAIAYIRFCLTRFSVRC